MQGRNMRTIVVLLFAAIVVAGCGGRAANPVMVHQYGDERKSCKAIERELQFIEEEITRLVPKTDKTGKNVALGITGWFFIVPWFFMDLSQAEQIEVNAYRQRYNHLVVLAADKNCGMERQQIPDFTRPPEESNEQTSGP